MLNGMMAGTSMAVLVHTAEDEQPDGEGRARENVVHETGLFQGKLGFERVIVLREQGCAPFSNLAGLVEIRFDHGHIRSTQGEIVSTIDREFPNRAVQR